VAGVSDEFCQAEEEGEGAGGDAAEGDDQREPASVGVWALAGDTTEDGEDEQGGDRSHEEDGGAGGEELSSISLHRDETGKAGSAVGCEHGVDDDSAD